MPDQTQQRLPLFMLCALVIGSMIGAGMCMLARVFQTFAGKRLGVLPQLCSYLGNPATGVSTDAH